MNTSDRYVVVIRDTKNSSPLGVIHAPQMNKIAAEQLAACVQEIFDGRSKARFEGMEAVAFPCLATLGRG